MEEQVRDMIEEWGPLDWPEEGESTYGDWEDWADGESIEREYLPIQHVYPQFWESAEESYWEEPEEGEHPAAHPLHHRHKHLSWIEYTPPTR
ncbi:hypothetical protein OQA88_1812 [Cercophora sp. LCS_1]